VHAEAAAPVPSSRATDWLHVIFRVSDARATALPLPTVAAT
jgi:hypothetical protein